MAPCYVGTSGWSYQHGQAYFYTGVERKDWLNFYAERFSAVEVNGTFYRLRLGLVQQMPAKNDA